MIQIEHNGVTLMVPEGGRFAVGRGEPLFDVYDIGLQPIRDILLGELGPLALDDLCNAAIVACEDAAFALVHDGMSAGEFVAGWKSRKHLHVESDKWRQVKKGARG